MDSIYIVALRNAYLALEEQIGKGDFNENYNDCFYAIGTMLHWMLDVIDRLCGDKSQYNGFRFINNQLKHNVNVVELHSIFGGLCFQENGIAFGVIDDDEKVESTFSFPKYELIWKEIIAADLDERYTTRYCFINQFEAYQKTLQNKCIFDTFTIAYKSIMDEASKLQV